MKTLRSSLNASAGQQPARGSFPTATRLPCVCHTCGTRSPRVPLVFPIRNSTPRIQDYRHWFTQNTPVPVECESAVSYRNYQWHSCGDRVAHVWQPRGRRVALVRLLRRRSNMTLKGVSRDPTGNQKEVPASITNQLSAKRHPLSQKPICNGFGRREIVPVSL